MTHFTHDYEQGIRDEQERIIALIQAQIAECGEDCDYCVAQADIIEAIRE